MFNERLSIAVLVRLKTWKLLVITDLLSLLENKSEVR